MAQNDWGSLSGGLTPTQVRSGPTAGAVAPNGGGNHVFAMRSVEATAGAAGIYALQTNFSPTPVGHGGRITAAIKRASLGASNGFAPFLFFCADSASVGAQAYLLGMSDETSSRIQLRKGLISDGLAAVSLVAPSAAPNVLMRSSDVFAADVWQHLRLDVIVQGTGDVLLQVYRNDLALHPVTGPVWAVVPGMEGPYAGFRGFVDDSIGINTGSLPLTSGFAGLAARFETSNRACFYDVVSIDRQL